MAQINTRLAREIRRRFKKYATQVGLDAAELARLLIVREMRVQRIIPLRGRGTISKRPASKNRRKLTAHFHRAKSVSEFDTYAHSYGYNRANAAKLIFEHELNEQWLLNAFNYFPRTRRRIS